MSVTPGDRIGPYEVVGLLGAGRMGEVYRARDHRLRRDVALKVVSPRFAPDAQGRARLTREAHLLATLNHPNIATLYGLEEAGGIQALVLELVEGETLADRLAGRPGGLRLPDALAVAQQVAAALDAAHERGIVHRDLKPANIALRPDGTVKLLDFGLATVLDRSSSGGLATATVTLDESAGAILGTPAYMSPEQARGLPMDRRTDIWAFGCVLYEMLAGRRAFEGEGASDVVARIIEREPDLNALPPATPAAVRRVVRWCLAQEPAHRLRDIGDAGLELADAVAGHADAPPAPPRYGRRTAMAVGASGVAGAVATWLGLRQWPTAMPAPESREYVSMPVNLAPGVTVTRGAPSAASSLALSPNGRTLVIAGTDAEGQQQLYARTLDRLEAVPIEGTAGGSSPFFSPGGDWIGFFAEGRLRRVPAPPARAGRPFDITAVPGFPAGASWSRDDQIAFASGARSIVRMVAAGGGRVDDLTRLEGSAGGHFRPEFLPDGRTLVFDSGSQVHALDIGTGEQTSLTEGAAPRYAPSGHLIFAREDTLYAAPFDASSHSLTGPAEPVVPGVAAERPEVGGGRHYALSRSGAFAYVPGALYWLVYRDAGGTEHPIFGRGRRSVADPRFSPDGRSVAVAMSERASEPPDIWVYDVDRADDVRLTFPHSTLTFEGGRTPVWTRDGTAVTYIRPAGVGGRSSIRRVDLQSEREPEPIAVEEFHWLIGWRRDGALLAGRMEGTTEDGTSPSSIVAFADGEPRLVVGPGNIWGGRLSHDGRWLAYWEVESGTSQVYITPSDGRGGKRLITDEGGGYLPVWGPDDVEVYYTSADRLMAARVDTTSAAPARERRTVIESFPARQLGYDVHSGDGSIVFVRPAAPDDDVRWILGWVTELPEAIRR